MICSYSLPKFVPRILKGIKKHTFREDLNGRWKVGMKMHQWFRNPRLKGKCKDGIDPYPFADHVLKSKQRVLINLSDDLHGFSITIEGKRIGDDQMEQIAISDGFDNVEEFKNWFLPKGHSVWVGWLLHWTDLTY